MSLRVNIKSSVSVKYLLSTLTFVFPLVKNFSSLIRCKTSSASIVIFLILSIIFTSPLASKTEVSLLYLKNSLELIATPSLLTARLLPFV